MISREHQGFIFHPVITSHWCHYRRQRRNCPLLFSICLLALIPLSASLSDWPACLSALSTHLFVLFLLHCALILLHRLSLFTSLRPVQCAPVHHFLIPSTSPLRALNSSLTSHLTLLSAALKNADRHVSEMAFPCEKSHRPANHLE